MTLSSGRVAVGIPGVSRINPERTPGGVELTSEKLVDYLKTAEVLIFDPIHQPAPDPTQPVTIYFQTQGYLNREISQYVETWLSRGWVVVEHNIFGLASKYRLARPNFFVATSSKDSAIRFRYRQWLVSGGRQIPHTIILPKPIRWEAVTDEKPARNEHVRLLRIGRPDPRKWTRFEFRYARSLALQRPDLDIQLTLVGCPEMVYKSVPPNLRLHQIPYQKNPSTLYRTHTHYLHHSRIGETYGNTIAEAQASGLSLILTLDAKKDAGFTDFVGADHAVFGYPIVLIRRAAEVFHEANLRDSAASKAPTTVREFANRIFEPHPVDFPHPVSNLMAHSGWLSRQAHFGRQQNPATTLVSEGLKCLLNQNKVDAPIT